jgi:hypothetical protein
MSWCECVGLPFGWPGCVVCVLFLCSLLNIMMRSSPTFFEKKRGQETGEGMKLCFWHANYEG